MGRLVVAIATWLVIAVVGWRPPWLFPSNDVVIDIEEGAWTAWNAIDDPLAKFRFRGYGSFDVVANATLRHQLEVALARPWRHANLWITPATVTFRIRWTDGSRSVYRMTAADLSRARYAVGESLDASRNVMPDVDLMRRETVHRYEGVRTFSTWDEMADWVALAAMFDVPVAGPESKRYRIRCAVATTGRLGCAYDG